jgi:lathosterol oxidase
MQPAGRETPPLTVEVLDSLRAMWVFAALAAWPAAAFAAGERTAIVFTLAEAMPGWSSPRAALAGYLGQLLLLTLVVDAYSHLKHRMMHTALLWDFHKTHHTYRDPSPFAGFAVHPVEAFLTFVPVLGILRPEMPVWAHAYAIWTLTWFAINLYLHSGYEVDLLERILAPLFINSSGYHNYHHELMYTNVRAQNLRARSGSRRFRSSPRAPHARPTRKTSPHFSPSLLSLSLL